MSQGNQGSDAYAAAGVDYGSLDTFKREAQRVAAAPSQVEGVRALDWTRGESCFVTEILVPGAAPIRIAHVEEGLGTKSLVADAMIALHERGAYSIEAEGTYHAIAQDTVAMIVNDMITVGARPVSIAMHLAVEDGSWFINKKRSDALLAGWRYACDQSLALMGPGETPALKKIVAPEASLISGSAVGILLGEPIQSSNMRSGDRIVLVASSGIHANGLTLARKIADEHEHGYLTVLKDSYYYGEALLQPTVNYVRLVMALREQMFINYAINITGHGWRKLMRAVERFAYTIETMPEPSDLFDFMVWSAQLSPEDAYATFNMGAGFALIVDSRDVPRVLETAKRLGYKAWDAGFIEGASSSSVCIAPLGITYEADTLQVR